MISCTEFIPAYSELFKFIDKKSGRQAVYDYWNWLFQPEKSPLNEHLERAGIRGCWDYWTVIHIEEACDNTQVFDEQAGWHISCMHSCPSKGRFDKLGYLEPFDEYCKHCDGYEWSLKKHGLVQYNDFRGDDHACCRTLIIDPKKLQGNPMEMVEKMYQCEMNGCTADTTGCPFATENSIQQTTTSEGYKYLHPEFHVSMDRGSGFVLDTYGMEGLKEYLTQFTLAFHVPLLANIREKGLTAIADYLRWLYDTEEAPDALELEQTDGALSVKIKYCPAVKYMKGRGYTPNASYEYCTSMVYEALAEAGGLGFAMCSYDQETGAATYRFFEK